MLLDRWTESFPFLGDYHPVRMQRGELIIMDGNRCRHFNQRNVEQPPCTRVSLDFRAMSREAYAQTVEDSAQPSAQSFTTKQKFVVGAYYTTMSRSPAAVAAASAVSHTTMSDTAGSIPGSTHEPKDVDSEACAAAARRALDAKSTAAHTAENLVGHIMAEHNMSDPWDVVALFEQQVVAALCSLLQLHRASANIIFFG